MWKALMVGAVLGATAAVAQAPAETSEKKAGLSQDPNEIVCVNQREIGSRLSRRRVCRTRAEWAQVQQQTRATIDRTQTYKVSCENGRC